jgi:hypothetical protein
VLRRRWIVLAGTLVVALAGCGASSTTRRSSVVIPPSLRTFAVGASSTSVGEVPEAIPIPSRAEERRATRLLHASQSLARLLHGASYRIAHKGPWTTGGRRDRLVGIVYWLDLARTTASIAGKWPTAVYEPKRFPPYIERSEYFKAFEVGTLFVEVDLIRGRVAGVTPSQPEPQHPESIGGPTTIPVEPPSPVARAGGHQLAEFYFGRAVTAQSGCLACHRIGETGNTGPGPDLTRVGARLPARAIERAIVHASAPMPSFRYLPEAKLAAVVTFLSLLRE